MFQADFAREYPVNSAGRSPVRRSPATRCDRAPGATTVIQYGRWFYLCLSLAIRRPREPVIPIKNKLLEAKGLTKVTEGAVLVTGIKGPLEDGWQDKVTASADQIMATAGTQPG